MAPLVDVHQHIAHKGPVDLQLVQRQALQVGQRRIAGAEVVQREAQAMLLQLGHLVDDLLDIFHQHAFGQFQLEVLGVGAGAVKSLQHVFDELRLAELQGADVDGHRQMSGLLSACPGGNLRAGGLQNPISQGQNQPRLLGQRNELVRRHQAALGCCQRISASAPINRPRSTCG